MTAAIDIRPIRADELVDFGRAFAIGFGETWEPDEHEAWRPLFELERSLAAFDGAKMVATAGIQSFELTLPGLTTTAAAGVTAVSVLPTYRRRGILTAVMRRQLEDVRQRGEAVALLYASETPIYGRYGYGMSTMEAHYAIDRRQGTLARVPEPRGQVALIDIGEAARSLPPVYDRFRRGIPGGLNRSTAWWDLWLKDLPSSRRGGSERFYVTYSGESGATEGYAAYRMKRDWTGGFPAYTLMLVDLATDSPDAYAALWRYCLSMDLVATVEASRRSIDEQVRWMLADPRRLRVEGLIDGLWARVVDVPAALAARRYLIDGRLVFMVTDPFCPDNDGTYRLEGGPDGAECRRTEEEPELALRIDDLGAIYLGGARWTNLAAAGRVEECRAGVLRKADAMFMSLHTPWCDQHF